MKSIALIYLCYDNKLFLQKRMNPNHRYYNLWELPGGKIEEGETPVAAAVRELYEEVGIEVTQEMCDFVGDIQVTLNGQEYSFYQYKIFLREEQIIPAGTKWFSKEEIFLLVEDELLPPATIIMFEKELLPDLSGILVKV